MAPRIRDALCQLARAKKVYVSGISIVKRANFARAKTSTVNLALTPSTRQTKTGVVAEVIMTVVKGAGVPTRADRFVSYAPLPPLPPLRRKSIAVANMILVAVRANFARANSRSVNPATTPPTTDPINKSGAVAKEILIVGGAPTVPAQTNRIARYAKRTPLPQLATKIIAIATLFVESTNHPRSK